MESGVATAPNAVARRNEIEAEAQHEVWNHWPVSWSAVWVGALAAICAVVLFGLIGVALGAHLVGPEHRVVDLKKIGLWTLVFSVFSAFLSFVLGGWVAGKIAGVRRSEPGMLHGAIAWLVAVPLLVLLAGLGASSYFGGWYGGLAWSNNSGPAPGVPFVRPEVPYAGATDQERAQFRAEEAEYNQKVKQWQEDTPKATRNGALGALTALLLGLVGSVIGGWMASGEPMTFTYHLTRPATTSERWQHA
jgi:hypothetical protein